MSTKRPEDCATWSTVSDHVRASAQPSRARPTHGATRGTPTMTMYRSRKRRARDRSAKRFALEARVRYARGTVPRYRQRTKGPRGSSTRIDRGARLSEAPPRRLSYRRSGAVVATNADGLRGMIPGKPLGIADLDVNSWGGTRTRDPGIMSAVL